MALQAFEVLNPVSFKGQRIARGHVIMMDPKEADGNPRFQKTKRKPTPVTELSYPPKKPDGLPVALKFGAKKEAKTEQKANEEPQKPSDDQKPPKTPVEGGGSDSDAPDMELKDEKDLSGL